jgi:benzoyl-CoA-dihydrodiol lyase
MAESTEHHPPVRFARTPEGYRHWRLQIEGGLATLSLAVAPDGGLRPGYELKLNSYDLGVDLELADAIRRLRFEHPEVRALVLTSAVPRVFCAGANIRMLAQSGHGFKVNFCKFTNETRCELEDLSAHSGVAALAAVNGACAGGGYELALACDEILLIDDGSSAVSLPEVPLLGVLPGTGGLTRLVDKRRVRRDLADLFCTKAEGFRLGDARRMGLVDGGFPRSRWQEGVAARAAELIQARGGVGSERGIALSPIEAAHQRQGDQERFDYGHVTLSLDHAARTASLELRGPAEAPPADHAALHAGGDATWALAAFRQLDEALLELRFNHPAVGLLLLRTQGSAAAVLAWDDAIGRLRAAGSWLAREVQLHQSRVLRRLDNMARSMFALIEPGSCFAGTLFELALAADRSYMLADPDQPTAIALHATNFGAHPGWNGRTRLQTRFLATPDAVTALAERGGEAFGAEEAEALGLITRAPDELDWDDEVRIEIEERVALSPDALTGMEQNLRFAGGETCDTKVFGRLTAWQNWIFQRPNAVGERGALVRYGHPEAPVFDWQRT